MGKIKNKLFPVTAITWKVRGSCQNYSMISSRTALLLLAVLLVPGGALLLIPALRKRLGFARTR